MEILEVSSQANSQEIIYMWGTLLIPQTGHQSTMQVHFRIYTVASCGNG